MKRKFRITLLAALLLYIVPTSAQEVVWNLGFDFRFDNREYGDPSKMVAPSETIFGANITPEIGLGWGYGNSLIVGTTLHADMGSERFFGEPEFIAYYNYASSHTPLRSSLGLFPRTKLIGRYSRAIFHENYNFVRPTVEGALLQYVRPNWYAEISCDWNGLRSATRREMFIISLAGEARGELLFDIFTYAGYNAMLHHHAASDTARGVTDNGLASLYVGLDLSALFDVNELALQGSWLIGYQNDRYHIGIPELPKGYELDLRLKVGNFGLADTFYKGENLMPYWDSPYEDAEGHIFGSSLYSGDPFYRVGESGFHNRLEVYWQPKVRDGVALKISSVHHYDGAHWGWQQRLTLSVDIGSRLFSSIR